MKLGYLITQSYIRAKIIGIILIVIGIIFIINPEPLNIKIGFTSILIGIFMIFMITEKSITKKTSNAQVDGNIETIEKIISFTQRLKQNQSKIKLVEPENLHMTMKFLGNIPETLAPKIYSILQQEINEKLFQGKTFEYKLKGVGQFNKFSVLWIKLLGNVQFLQNIT